MNGWMNVLGNFEVWLKDEDERYQDLGSKKPKIFGTGRSASMTMLRRSIGELLLFACFFSLDMLRFPLFLFSLVPLSSHGFSFSFTLSLPFAFGMFLSPLRQLESQIQYLLRHCYSLDLCISVDKSLN